MLDRWIEVLFSCYMHLFYLFIYWVMCLLFITFSTKVSSLKLDYLSIPFVNNVANNHICTQ